MRILIVEDDRKVAAFIQRGLEEEGHAVDVLHDGAEAGAQAHAIDYDSGFQVLGDIRAKKTELPVLILTAKDSLDERVAGLDGGADDYMVKPFALAELSHDSGPSFAAGNHVRHGCGWQISSSMSGGESSRVEAGGSISSRGNTRCSNS